MRAWDPDPTQLRALFARRDKVLADQFMIVLFIDPVGNRKFAHFFRVNPRGAVGDGLFNEDSGAEDFSPAFDFEVVTGRFEGGWTAEFRIPFSSLRYDDPPSQQWTTMVFRNYPRDERYRAKLYSEVAWGDRVDVLSNRLGEGHFHTVHANLRPGSGISARATTPRRFRWCTGTAGGLGRPFTWEPTSRAIAIPTPPCAPTRRKYLPRARGPSTCSEA